MYSKAWSIEFILQMLLNNEDITAKWQRLKNTVRFKNQLKVLLPGKFPHSASVSRLNTFFNFLKKNAMANGFACTDILWVWIPM